MSDDYPTVSISSQPIELCKLLKVANMVSGGGEAKIVISEGYVYLNGEVEFQKRKKVYDNDIIEFNGEIIQVTCSKTKSTADKTKSVKVSKNKKNTAKPKAQKIQQASADYENEIASTPAKRRPISF